MAGAQLSQLAMTTTDVAFVGRLRGESLAAMAVGQASYGVFLAFGIGLVAAVSPLSSQAFGAGRREDTARPMGAGILCALIFGVLSWLALYRIDALFHMLGYEPSVARLATEYVRNIMVGLPAFFVFLSVKNYFDSTSRPRLPFLVAFLAVGINALAAYGLVYGAWGLPELGVVGVARTTASVNALMAVSLMALVWSELEPGALRPRPHELVEFLRVGLPIAGSLLLEVGLFVMAALLMGRLGTEEAAAHQIVITCASSTFMIPLGISFAGAARVGHAVGAERYADVRPAGLAAMAVGAGCMLLSGALFASIPGHLVDIFWDPSGDPGKVRQFAVDLLLVAGIFQLFDGLQVTASGALRGMKDVKVPLLIALLGYWFVGLGTASYLAFFTPLRHQGVWLGLLTGLACTGVSLSLRFAWLSARLPDDVGLQRRARGLVHTP